MKYKFQIGDLVVFQTAHVDILGWEKGENAPYLTGMITFRDKAGYTYRHLNGPEKENRNNYYHILLPSGETHYLQREDRLALLAKANP
jgi:hypothetical protein